MGVPEGHPGSSQQNREVLSVCTQSAETASLLSNPHALNSQALLSLYPLSSLALSCSQTAHFTSNYLLPLLNLLRNYIRTNPHLTPYHTFSSSFVFCSQPESAMVLAQHFFVFVQHLENISLIHFGFSLVTMEIEVTAK